MTGIAALAMCAGFTSCSHDLEAPSQEEINEANAQRITNSYNQAFIATFGHPAANQDWGFSSSSTRALTRANSGQNYAATHEYTDASGKVIAGANMNHNEWADPDKGFGGWVVPAPLTNDQKALVARYFQTVNDMNYVDPQLRHFFVQQVYTGGNTTVNNTTEGIIAADNSAYTSANMNLMTVGQYNSHINDFNAGTCSASDVLDNGQHVGGTSHSDQITLMVNVDDTSCFGYHETGSSTHHNDKAALVSWQTIAQWQVNNGEISSIEASILNDTWDRSFLGFDLAIKEGAQAYATDEAGNVQYADYSQAPTSPAYAWDGENIIEIKAKVANQWGGYDFTDFLPAYQNIMKGTEAIGWLTTNKNFYVAADNVTLTGEANASEKPISEVYSDNVLVFKDVKVEGASNNKAHVLNLKRIQELVGQGYLPVNNKSLTEWVKVGTSDGYYSDWIVTLTEAKRIPTNTTPADLRIMAEDLSATEASDFDFNDVVFDVYFAKEGESETKILVRAAGGTLPLQIKVSDTEWQEVHGLWGLGTGIMINTGAEAMFGSSKGADGRGSKELTLKYPIRNAEQAKNITIQVQKALPNGQKQWMEMTAPTGEPAAKFAIPAPNPDSENWCNERTPIQTKYTKFTDWVQGQSNIKWWLGTAQ